MNTQKLEIQINSENISAVKNNIRALSLKYEEDFFLEDVLFIEIKEANLSKLKKIKGIKIEKEKYAYQM